MRLVRQLRIEAWRETDGALVAISPGGRSADASPLGKGALFATPGLKLPTYVREVANALIRSGHAKSSAIALAVASIKRWARGGDNVRPQVQAAAVKALAEWELAKSTARSIPNKH